MPHTKNKIQTFVSAYLRRNRIPYTFVIGKGIY